MYYKLKYIKVTESGIKLLGKTDNYFYFPNNTKDILKMSGKFGSTYKGVKESDNSRVVIKKLNPILKSSQQSLERFEQENIIFPDISNIPDTLEFMEQDHDYYLIRKYIEGTDLKSLLKDYQKRKKITIEFAIRLVIKLLEILETIHSKEILHRDIKPSNIIIEFETNTKKINFENPVIQLIDFGLAKLPDSATKVILYKTPFSMVYAPPEQVLNYNSLVNATSDIYSLGICLYELITGKIPFQVDHPAKLINLQINREIKPDSKLPGELFKILRKATHKYHFQLPPNRYKRNEIKEMLISGQKGRYQTAKEMKEIIQNLIIKPELLRLDNSMLIFKEKIKRLFHL
jgi:eukaryotic-like serine/threonine-protein kinase